jgi:hypothetical protein
MKGVDQRSGTSALQLGAVKKERKSWELAHKRPKLDNIGTSARRREDKYEDEEALETNAQ